MLRLSWLAVEAPKGLPELTYAKNREKSMMVENLHPAVLFSNFLHDEDQVISDQKGVPHVKMENSVQLFSRCMELQGYFLCARCSRKRICEGHGDDV